MLPGVYSVIVPLPSVVVVVVVVVSETCAHAKGAASAKTMLSNSFFIVFFLLLCSAGERFRLTSFPSRPETRSPPRHAVIVHRPLSGCHYGYDLRQRTLRTRH